MTSPMDRARNPRAWLRHIFLASASFVLLQPTAATANVRNLGQFHYQYFSAIHQGDIAKARDLAEMGTINPNNIAGKPLVSYLFTVGGKLPASISFLSNAAFDYVFKELKQPFNAMEAVSGQRTVFSMMCLNMFRSSGFGGGEYVNFQTSLARIRYALSQGADPRHRDGVGEHMRKYQPLPECLTMYRTIRHPGVRAEMLALLDEYLAKGADPDYTLPILDAAKTYDTDLFKLLVKHDAKNGRVFGIENLHHRCGRRLPNSLFTTTPEKNTLLASLPYPKDADTQVARVFLEAFIEAGGDISEKQHRFSSDGLRCVHQQTTLQESAVNAGQITYAKMVLELRKSYVPAKRAAPQPAATAQPDPAARKPSLSGIRIVTSSFNVREQPDISGRLLATLGPNAIVQIEEPSDDGEWTLIMSPPNIQGWANTAVILRSSTPNAPSP